MRLTTHAGLVPMVAGLEGTFSWQLADLVFARWHDHFVDLSLDASRVTFKRKAESPFTSVELAAELRSPGLVRASAPDAHTVIAEFESPEQAKHARAHAMLDVGEFRQASFTPRSDEQPARLVLERRRPGPGFRQIEVTAVATEEEEWRRLLAGDADMIPMIAPAYGTYLDDLATVRMVKFDRRTKVGILFRTESEAVASPEVRRAITLALRRRALARYAVGDETAAIEAPEDMAEARRILEAHREKTGRKLVLRMLVIEEASDIARTALAVEQQLASFDVEVEWQPVSVDTAMARLTERGTFDALIFPGGGFEKPSWPLVVKNNGVTNYENPELDAAIARGDADAVRAIIERDAPMTPLYGAAQYVVADRSLCGVTPEKPSNYTWLAGVHPCPEAAR